MSSDPNCLFCRIVRGEIPAKIVAQTPECVAFLDIDPRAPSHVVIIPRDHIPSLNDVTDPQVVGRMAMLAAALAKDLGIAESGYRTVINTNGDGGQTVFHLHMHLLGGRHFSWPPG
ncbi:MAG: histidine triad nucleotide-binding protein [Gemmatimonadaceae bacterium]